MWGFQNASGNRKVLPKQTSIRYSSYLATTDTMFITCTYMWKRPYLISISHFHLFNSSSCLPLINFSYKNGVHLNNWHLIKIDLLMISGVSSQHLIGHEIIERKMKDNKYILSSSKIKKKRNFKFSFSLQIKSHLVKIDWT